MFVLYLSGAWLVIGVCSAVTRVELASCTVLSLVCIMCQTIVFCFDKFAVSIILVNLPICENFLLFTHMLQIFLIYVSQNLCLVNLPTHEDFLFLNLFASPCSLPYCRQFNFMWLIYIIVMLQGMKNFEVLLAMSGKEYWYAYLMLYLRILGQARIVFHLDLPVTHF